MTDIPKYPAPEQKKEDPVSRSLAKPDACAKPCTMGSRGVRVRPMSEKQWHKVKVRKKKKNWDRRDVTFY